MTFFERTRDVKSLRHWEGNVEADYIYTTGIAGDHFFKELRDNGRIVGSYCEKCKETFLPPKMYCENCLGETRNWKEVGKRGKVVTYTIAYVDEGGNELEKPIVWAMVNIDGVKGGILHKLNIKPEKVRIGMGVEAVLKPKEERQGNILDIQYFKSI